MQQNFENILSIFNDRKIARNKAKESRKQRQKVGEAAYSSWQELLYGLLHLSVLGLLLFNIFLCDLFYFLEGTYIASYVEDTAPYNASSINLRNNFYFFQMV